MVICSFQGMQATRLPTLVPALAQVFGTHVWGPHSGILLLGCSDGYSGVVLEATGSHFESIPVIFLVICPNPSRMSGTYPLH